jgi:hypothetical protein
MFTRRYACDPPPYANTSDCPMRGLLGNREVNAIRASHFPVRKYLGIGYEDILIHLTTYTYHFTTLFTSQHYSLHNIIHFTTLFTSQNYSLASPFSTSTKPNLLCCSCSCPRTCSRSFTIIFFTYFTLSFLLNLYSRPVRNVGLRIYLESIV